MDIENSNSEQSIDTDVTESFSDFELFKKILFFPRQAFRFIDQNHYEKYSTLLVVLYGISYCIDHAIDKQSGNNISPIALFFIVAIASPIVGFLYINIYAILLGITGKWLGGDATINQFSRILPYTTLPLTIGIFYVAISIILCGYDLFIDVEGIVEDSLIVGLLVGLLLIFRGVLGVWTIVLIIIAVSEIQKFSIRRAFLNVIFPSIFLVLLFLGIFMFVEIMTFLEGLL